jgi:hypothetical protein
LSRESKNGRPSLPSRPVVIKNICYQPFSSSVNMQQPTWMAPAVEHNVPTLVLQQNARTPHFLATSKRHNHHLLCTVVRLVHHKQCCYKTLFFVCSCTPAAAAAEERLLASRHGGILGIERNRQSKEIVNGLPRTRLQTRGKMPGNYKSTDLRRRRAQSAYCFSVETVEKGRRELSTRIFPRRNRGK